MSTTRADRRRQMREVGYHRADDKRGRRPTIRARVRSDEGAYAELERRGFVIPEPVPEIGVRAYVEPQGWEPTRSPVRERRTSRQALVVFAEPAGDGDFGGGSWGITDRDAPSVPVRSGLVDTDTSNEEFEDVASGGLDLRRLPEFVRGVLLPQAWRRQIPLVGFDLSRTLGLAACDWTAAKDGDGLSLILASATADALTPKQRRGRRRLRDGGYEMPWIPRVVVNALDGERAFMSFARTIDRGKGGPGHFVDLRVVAGAQGLNARTVAELASSLGLPVPEVQGQELLVAEAGTLARCYWRILARHEQIAGRAWDVDRIQSGGSYAKALYERLGLVPPLVKWPDFPKWALGAAAEAFYGGEYHLEHRGEAIPDALPFDIQSEYGLGAVLVGAWDVLAARKLKVEPVDPAHLIEYIRTLTPDDALDPQLHAELGFVFARVVPRGQVLPSRPATDGEWPLRVAPTWCAEPTWHHALTLVRAVLDPSGPPFEDDQIVEAFQVVPEGRQRGLRAIDLPGVGRFDPKRRGADLFRFLGKGRALLQAGEPQSDLGPWTAGDLSRFLKGMIAMAAYGVFAEVRTRRARGRPERMTVWAGDREPRQAHMGVVEEPGPWQCWPIAAAVTSAGRLMFHAVGQLVASESGRRLYGDTDSCIATDLSPEAALRVQARFERLNPYGVGGPRITVGPDGRLRLYPDHHYGPLLLRIQPEAWSDEPRIDETGERYFEQVPLTFVGWHSKRYVLLDPQGRARMYSESGLGALLDPRRIEPGAPSDWIGEALEHVAGTGSEPAWVGAWQLAVVPANSPEVSRLYEGKTAKRLALRPWEPLVLAYEDVLVGKGRVLAAPWRPGFDPARAAWRVFGSGERVKAKPARPRDYELDPEGPDHVEVRTMAGELRRYSLVAERGTLGPDGKPCRRGTVGPLVPRPIAASRLRRIGKESHALEEALTGNRESLTAYPADRQGSRSPADQAFRDAVKVLRRERDAGRDLNVRDTRNRRVPGNVVDAALASRTAAPKVRAWVVQAAARIVGDSPRSVATIALAVSHCGWCGVPLPKGRTRWCSDSCKFKALRAHRKVATS